MFEVKTRFRFSSEGGVGKKTRFGGGRFVIGTPSLPLHKHFFYIHHHIHHHINLFLISLPHDINIFYPLSHHPPTSHTTKKIGLIETNPI